MGKTLVGQSTGLDGFFSRLDLSKLTKKTSFSCAATLDSILLQVLAFILASLTHFFVLFF